MSAACQPHRNVRVLSSPVLIQTTLSTGIAGVHDRVMATSNAPCACHNPGASAALSASSHALHQTTLIEASMEQLGMTLPPWAIRAGARKEIFFDPSQASVDSVRSTHASH